MVCDWGFGVNILFLSELFYPHGGGAELATYLYAKLLSEAGVNVTVVTNSFAGESEVSKDENLVVYRLPLFRGVEGVKYSMLGRVDVLCSGFLRKLVKWADVVYVPRFWFSAIVLAKIYRKPVVTHVHDYIPICPLTNLYDVSRDAICDHGRGFCSQSCIYAYERSGHRNLGGTLKSVLFNSSFGWCFGRIVGLSDAIVCVSKAQKELIVKNCNHLVSKIHVIYNPLPDTSPVDIQGDDFGYFGGPSYVKGFHVLCKAAAYVNRVRMSVGHKPLRIRATKFSSLSSEVSELLGQLGIFACGKLGSAQYRDLYDRIKAVIVPSVWAEPLPYVVSEAVMSGRIVIASRVGGIPEQVAGCEGTFLFEPGDYYALAKNILHVEGLSREKAVELGVRNREFIVKRFNNEKIVGEFSNLLEKVVD